MEETFFTEIYPFSDLMYFWGKEIFICFHDEPENQFLPSLRNKWGLDNKRKELLVETFYTVITPSKYIFETFVQETYDF